MSLNKLQLNIAIGRSRYEKKWKNKTFTWPELVHTLSETRRTAETYAEYMSAPRKKQDEIKDVGGFVGGHLKEGRRKNGYVENRSILTLDIDYAPPSFWQDLKSDMSLAIIPQFACCIYSTHKHSPNKPRLRLILPLAHPVGPEEYEAMARKVAEQIGIDYFDDTTFEPARLMYWPSTARDAEFFFDYLDGPAIDPEAILNLYHDWRDVNEWPESSRAQKKRHKTLDKLQKDPLGKQGLIGVFCRTYTIQAAIETFLPHIYVPGGGENRYTYAKGTTTNGLVVYDDKFAYSHHATDPAGGQLCNAFDLVRLHLYGALDQDAGPETPANKLPSWQAMIDFVANDDNCKVTAGREKLSQAKTDFDVPDQDDADGWLKKLEVDKKGNYVYSIENILIILENDPNLQGIGGLNLMSRRPEVFVELPWPRQSQYWADADQANLKRYLESVYGIDGERKIKDALIILFNKRAYHPVRNYLNELKWDGMPRVETVIIDYLGAEDSAYTRVLTRKCLTAAVARVMEPGIKFDYMVVLTGPTGIGKTMLVQKLAMQWFSNSLPPLNKSGKDLYEALDGVWIMEIGELAAFNKADREAIKNYISKQEDVYRRAYAQFTEFNKRQNIFIGTTNTKEFLDDTTGNRRFWVIPCSGDSNKKVWIDLTQAEVDQIWAEAYEIYKSGENIMELPQDVAKTAQEMQDRHADFNVRDGIIREYLDIPIPTNWEELSAWERKKWYASTEEFKDKSDKAKIQRTRVCAAEIWCEAFQQHIATLTKSASREINELLDRIEGWRRMEYPVKFGPYGNQRGFERITATDNAIDNKTAAKKLFIDWEDL